MRFDRLRRCVVLVVGAALAIGVLAAPSHPVTVDCDGIALLDGCLVTATGGDTAESNDGYAVTNADGVLFWDYYQSADLHQLGYPVTQRFLYSGFVVQGFQRAIVQWNPTRARVERVNLLDVLANDYPLVELPYVPAHRSFPETTGQPFAQVQAAHLQILDANPDLRAAFLSEPDWLNVYGLPINYAVFADGAVEVLRAQRAVLHVWRNPVPGITVGRVGQQNVVDKVKALSNVVIPNAAKQPITVEQATDGDGAPPPEPAPEPAPPSGPGFMAYGLQGEFRRSNDVTMLGLVADTGFGWIKQQVTWADVERNPDEFTWSELDRLVNNAHGKGLKILFGITKAPNFYKPARLAGQPGAPVDLTKFHRFVFLLAERYRGKVHAYEIWNEANIAREWGPLSESAPNDYLAMVKLGYQAVKEGDPSATVVLGALTQTGVNDPQVALDDLIYLQRLVAIDGGDVRNYFDALGVHVLPGPNAPDDTLANPVHSRATCGGLWADHPSFFFDRYKQLYQVLLNAGITDKSVWVTELGWASTLEPAMDFEYAACITEEDQARFLVRAFEKLRAESPYVTHAFVWNLNFQYEFDSSDERWAFGIVRSDGTYRLAYASLRDMPKPIAA